MRKSYFLMAAAATMFAACSQNEVLNEVQVQDEAQAIGFSTYAGKVTRAENNLTDYEWNLEDHHKSFTVYAGKMVKGSAQAVYSNLNEGTVSYSEAGWTASPLKFWDKTATEYYFYAGAPAGEAWEFDNNYTDGSLKYSGFALTGVNLAKGTSAYYYKWKGTDDVDLMIAAPKTVYRESYNTNTPAKVELEFNHILSRLNIKVKKGNNIVNSELKLTSLTVCGLKNRGSFDESLAPANQNGSNDRWSVQDGSTYNLTAAVPIDPITNEVYTHQYLVIPQDAALLEGVDINGESTFMKDEPYFKIEYTIAGEPYYAYYNLAAAFSTANLAFNEGWENTLTITINPQAIEFDAVVAKWSVSKPEGSVTIQ